MTRPLLLLALLLAAACTTSREPDRDEAAFDERVAVFLLADEAQLDSLRAEYGEDDFATIADDMMWYRAEAWRWLEERGVRVVDFDGRPPLRFRVDGAMRELELPAGSTLDLVVLYDPPRAPLVLAPIDVALQADAYFAAE